MEGAVLYGYAGLEPGRTNIGRFYQAFFAAFPDATLPFEDVIAAGDKVTCRVVLRGTHEGPFQGLPGDASHVRHPRHHHPALRGREVRGTLVEHIRLAQDDILDFCVNAKYEHTMAWPADYWPRTPAPPDDAAWDASIASVIASRRRFEALTQEVEGLTANVPTGDATQTYLRAVLLAADHVAYHVGQIVLVRKALGAWGKA